MRDAVSGSAAGFVGRIPVRNLWLLMLYAAQSELAGCGLGDRERPGADLPDLIAGLLAREVKGRLRRDLSVGYRARTADLRRVRGRIDALETERRQLLERGVVACVFSELTRDTVRNRYVRSALEVVARDARADLAHECRSLAHEMERAGVTGRRPGRAEIAADRTGRHDAHDAKMIALARLALASEIPREDVRAVPLPLPSREEGWVRRLFERAVRGFYWHHLSGVTSVEAPRLEWQVVRGSAGGLSLLPKMQTDIVLRRPGRHLLIDTKFTSMRETGGAWSATKETFKSDHIYQLLAYLRALEDATPGQSFDGMLLYPALGPEEDEWVSLRRYTLRFSTVNLTAPAPAFGARLSALVDSGAAPAE